MERPGAEGAAPVLVCADVDAVGAEDGGGRGGKFAGILTGPVGFGAAIEAGAEEGAVAAAPA